MNRQETANEVKRMILQDFGKPLNDLKVDIIMNYDKNPHGCSDHFKGKQGYSVFYTDNANFMQGTKNGGGAGFYARLYFVGCSTNIKL